MAAFLSRRRIGPEPGRARRAASPLPYYGTPDRATARAAGLFQIAGCRSELGDAQRHRAGVRHRLPPALVTPSEGRALPPAMLPEAAAPLTRRNPACSLNSRRGARAPAARRQHQQRQRRIREHAEQDGGLEQRQELEQEATRHQRPQRRARSTRPAAATTPAKVSTQRTTCT